MIGQRELNLKRKLAVMFCFVVGDGAETLLEIVQRDAPHRWEKELCGNG